jgi:hypothetical protein
MLSEKQAPPSGSTNWDMLIEPQRGLFELRLGGSGVIKPCLESDFILIPWLWLRVEILNEF